jgi:hypothetical protein
LPLSFDNFSKNVSLLLFKCGYLALKLDALIFELFQLLLELVFDVEIVISHFGLLSGILIVEVVELIHLEVEVLEGDLEGPDFFLVSLHGIVESQFLLLEDSLLGAETLAVSGDSGEGVLLLDQLSLVGDPLLLHLSNLIFHIIDFLLNVVLLGLEGTRILVLSILLLQLIQLTVQSVHTVLLLSYSNMALLDVSLKLFNFTLLILKLVDQIIKLLLKQLILRLSIEVIDTHTRDFISYVFNLDFLLRYLLIRDFSLLNQVST